MQHFDPNTPLVFATVAALFVCYALAGAFFWFNKNAALKRKVLPFAGVLLGALFLSWPLAAGMPLDALWTFAPMVAVMVWLNIRAMQFCAACGATVRGGVFSRPKFCPKCGASLQESKH